MKTTIFNFLVLQVVIWAFVFKSNDNSSTELKYASVTDTWEVAKIGSNKSGPVLHYPSFNKLTLNPDGTYIRLKTNGTIESGNWEINKLRSKLILKNGEVSKHYEIVHLPDTEEESFIIKEYIEISNINSDIIKYELNRI